MSRASFAKHMKAHRNAAATTGTEHDELGDSADGIDLYTQFMAENFDMTCDLCDTNFTSYYNARCHYKDAHNMTRGYVKCCNMKLRSQPNVNEHINSHLNPNLFRYCLPKQKCKQNFIRIFHCFLHLCYRCEVCKKGFSTKLHLYQHMYRHKRKVKRPFTCDMCGERFSEKIKILRHFFAKHIDVEHKFECEICNKR